MAIRKYLIFVQTGC